MSSPKGNLEAAIEILRGFTRQYDVMSGWLVEYDNSARYSPPDPPAGLTDDPYAVTLHMTIFPQMALMQSVLDIYGEWGLGSDIAIEKFEHVYILAEKIVKNYNPKT